MCGSKLQQKLGVKIHQEKSFWLASYPCSELARYSLLPGPSGYMVANRCQQLPLITLTQHILPLLPSQWFKFNPTSLASLKKIKDDQKWQNKIQNISEMWENGSKTRQNKWLQFGAQSSVVDIQIFSQRGVIKFKHKITTSASYMDSIGTGYTSHNKEICLHSKRIKNNFKNQSIKIRPLLMP